MQNTDGTFTFASAGAVFGFRYLDGRTQDGFVQLVGDTLPPFSGTKWTVREISPGVVTLLSHGDFNNPQHRFLDGRTQDGSLGLAASDQPSGTRWGTQIVARPSIAVHTRRQAIDSQIDVSGGGFTPNSQVKIVAEGIMGRQDHAPFLLPGFAHVGPDGRFSIPGETGFFPHHPANIDVIVRAYDQNGITASGRSNGFHP